MGSLLLEKIESILRLKVNGELSIVNRQFLKLDNEVNSHFTFTFQLFYNQLFGFCASSESDFY
jgi:16S rRNA G1207 methylase RsmC